MSLKQNIPEIFSSIENIIPHIFAAVETAANKYNLCQESWNVIKEFVEKDKQFPGYKDNKGESSELW